MKPYILPILIGASAILGTQAFAQSRSEEARERTIALASVPKPAVDAARQALGADPSEAKIISGTSPQQYELEAKNSSGRETSVHVQADGTIVKRETESGENERNERGAR